MNADVAIDKLGCETGAVSSLCAKLRAEFLEGGAARAAELIAVTLDTMRFAREAATVEGRLCKVGRDDSRNYSFS